MSKWIEFVLTVCMDCLCLSPEEEQALLKRYRELHDSAAFGRVFGVHRQKLWHFILSKNIPSEDAEDVLQNIALSLSNYLIKNTPTQLLPVLINLAKWRITDYFQTLGKRLKTEPLEHHPEPGISNDPLASLPGLRDLMAQQQVSPEQQEALILHMYVGYTLEEVAQITEIPRNTVRSRLRLALLKLRAAVPQEVSP